MDLGAKECRMAVFWEVYWRTKAAMTIPEETKRCKLALAFIRLGVGKCSAA